MSHAKEGRDVVCPACWFDMYSPDILDLPGLSSIDNPCDFSLTKDFLSRARLLQPFSCGVRRKATSDSADTR